MFRKDEDSERPPAYDNVSANEDDEVMQPTIMVLSLQSIHAESVDSAPLYRVNRGIDRLGHSTSRVDFERVERTVKTSTTGEPAIKPRDRQIYELHHRRSWETGLVPLPSDSPYYYIKAVSGKTVGNVGLKKSRFRSHWKALPLDLSGKKNEFGLPQFIKDARPLFEIHQTQNRYEWTDSNGNAIAVEDEGEDQHRLLVTASLHRETMDALVALWCCRIWQHSADHKEPVNEGMEQVRRRFRLAREAPGRGSQLLARG